MEFLSTTTLFAALVVRTQYILGNWSWISKVIQSPLFRASSLVPVVGYMIIYGDAFRDWFTFDSLGEVAFLSPSARLRLLYWGGVLMLIATTVHSLFCPRLIKRFPDEDEYLDNFALSATPKSVIDAWHNLALLTSGHQSRAAKLSNLLNSIARSIQVSDKPIMSVLGRDPTDVSADQFATATSQFRSYLGRSLDKVSIKEICLPLIAYNHSVTRTSKPTIRIFAVICAVLGICLAAIPALETCLRVLIMEFA